MAWKVIGFMHGQDGVGRCPPLYGPLPRKVWVKLPGERKPRMPKTKNALAGSDGRTKQEVNERMAKEYARWLAARDGVKLPTDRVARPLWVHVTTRAGKTESRVSAVYFGEVCIKIPNWDWQPLEPVETIVPVDEAFQDLGKRAMATLLDCLIAA